MTRGQQLRSPNGEFEFRMQSNGYYAFYYRGYLLQTTTDSGDRIVFDDEGNLAFYNDFLDSFVVWESKTRGAQFVELTNDGTLGVYDSKRNQLWYMGTQISMLILGFFY